MSERRGQEVGGTEIEGRRAVLELLRAGTREVRSVSLSEGVAHDDMVDAIVEAAGTKLRMVSPDRLRASAQTDAPQGVVARAEPLRSADFDALLADPRAFLVVLDGVTDPRNLGAIVRAAETAGVTGMVIAKHRSAPVSATAAKTAAGAIEYVPIALVGGIPAALERAKRAGVWCIGLDGDSGTTLTDLPFATEPLAIVLGAEGRGLSPLTRRRCDALARIPMRGAIASLNVAAAAAVACHEIARRRGSPSVLPAPQGRSGPVLPAPRGRSGHGSASRLEGPSPG
ncbi:MAG: rRNA (guanosine2251-2-O)-methyltransferase [Actinomycetota bacterium]|nr:rRNA (guanosine2251-2-O)-methyltransferase [Actinomycetota bacterium]